MDQAEKVRVNRHSKHAGYGGGHVTISQPADNTQCTAGTTINANGTYDVSNNYQVSNVSVTYEDETGTAQKISGAVTQQPNGTWTTSFTLPKANWKYILCARAMKIQPPLTMDNDDHFLTTSS